MGRIKELREGAQGAIQGTFQTLWMFYREFQEYEATLVKKLPTPWLLFNNKRRLFERLFLCGDSSLEVPFGKNQYFTSFRHLKDSVIELNQALSGVVEASFGGPPTKYQARVYFKLL